MKIRCGDRTVIESGVVASVGMEDVKFYVNDKPLIILTVKAVTDKNNSEQSINIKLIDQENIQLIFTNAHLTLGFGPLAPVHIANIADKKLFICIKISTFGAPDPNSYQLLHTFYLED